MARIKEWFVGLRLCMGREESYLGGGIETRFDVWRRVASLFKGVFL